MVGTYTYIHRLHINYRQKNKRSFEIPDKKWLLDMPKIELHAHLHGSIPAMTLASIYKEKHLSGDPSKEIDMILKTHKTFDDAFALFKIIHDVVTTESVLRKITKSVFESFAKDGIRYLEIRTTPRALDDASRREYIDIVISEIKSFEKECNDMIVKLILAIDNVKGFDEGEETVNLAIDICKEMKDECPIVGIDFAPRPSTLKGTGHLDVYGVLLKKARYNGLKITIHFAEYQNDLENIMTLNFKPDRLGHSVYLSSKDWESIQKMRIPIEACPTSNLFTRSVNAYENHPFGKWFKSGHPVTICTDDKGVFDSILSNEWTHMAKAFKLTKKDCKEISMRTVDYIFMDDELKLKFKSQFSKYWTDFENKMSIK